MFKLSSKKFFWRSAIFSLFVVIAAITVGIKVAEQNNQTAEAAGETIYVGKSGDVYYGYSGIQAGVYYVGDGENTTAFCAQPHIRTIPSGSYYSYGEYTGTNADVIKLFLYIALNNNSTTSSARQSLWYNYGIESSEKIYAWTHATLGPLYNPNASYSEQYIFLEDYEINNTNARIATVRGYIANNDPVWQAAKDYTLYVTNGGSNQDIMWIEAPKTQYGKLIVNKIDADTGSCSTTTGSLSLNGTTFEVIDSTGAVVATKTLSNGACSVEFDNLEYGSYTVREKNAATGYTKDTDKTVNVNAESVTVEMANTPTKYKITVNKIDGDTGTCTNSAALSFSGIKFTLVNNTGGPIKYGNNIIANGNDVDSKTLSGDSCTVEFTGLPNGNYTIKESSVTNGYTGDSDQTVTISSANQTVQFTNNPKKGKIIVNKTDSDTGSCTPTGNLSLVGTQFTLVNSTGGPVKYNGVSYANGVVVAVKTVASGACSVEFDNLPYGKYTIQETSASTGYTADSASKEITLSGDTASVAFSNTSVKGKITVSKTDTKTGTCTTQGNASFNGTKFEITNNSTNAVYYGGRAFAKGAVIDTKTLTNDACSVTFENLPYGTYIVKEIAVGTGYNVDSTAKTVTIPTNNSVNVSTSYANDAILGSVTVNKIDKDTGTCTTTGDLSFDGATFSITNNSTNPIYYGNKVVAKGGVIDTKALSGGACSVKFEGLPYGEYIIKETKTSEGYVLNTTPYTVTIPTNNVVDVSTEVANQVIRGDVKFVKMDKTNNKTMKDVIFSISAVDKNNNIKETHIVVSNQDGIVNTSSSFVRHSYNTNGYDPLYDEVDPIQFSGYGDWFGIDNNGNAIPVHDGVGALPYGTYIIQELRCGSNFFCTGILNQKTTVTINSANQVIDLGDWDNACTNFSLGTTATDNKDGDKFIEIDEKVELKDTVEYCVKPNTDFILKGILMDKSTGEPLLINGETVEQQVKIRSSEECGTTEMIFTFDASSLGGKTLVVFESLYFSNGFETYLITEHNDIDDAEQTVDLVSLRTYATNDETGDKVLPADSDVKIKDVVTYCLRPGVEYTIKGVLMDKRTGNGLLVNSEPVESELTFTPQEACGTVDMFYTLNTTDLGGADLVIFESLYYDDEMIVEHRDINNTDETVSVELPAPNTGSLLMDALGSKGISWVEVAIVVVVVPVVGYAGVRYLSRRRMFKK